MQVVPRLSVEPMRYEDIAAVRDPGLSEDQVFEIVVCAAMAMLGP